MDIGQIKNRLLIVDGDPKSLRVLEVSLKKAGFEVATAAQGSEALVALQAALPDLIISDTDLDGIDGFDLCRQIKAKPEWAKIPFLFVSGRKSIEDKIRGLELGVEDYLTKPIYIKEIAIRVRTTLQRAERERLESRREGRTKFAGDLEDIGVVDLVQTIDLNRKSGIIHIVNRDGRRGAVFFREGRVIDAEVGRLSGAEAMFRMFSWSEGRFEVDFKPIRRRDVVNLPSAALLMEGMRRLDEWTRILESMPPLDGLVEVDFKVLAEQLADLPDEMNSLLRLCDGSRTLLAVMDDCDFPDLEALTLASKLFMERIIFVRKTEKPTAGSEPGGELARWLAERNPEDGAAADNERRALETAGEADSSLLKDLTAEEQLDTAIKESGERKEGKPFRNSTLEQPTPTLDGFFSNPAAESPAAELRTGSTLKLVAVASDPRSSHEEPASESNHAPVQPVAGSAVVEESWRDPGELPVGESFSPVETKPTEEGDTLRGIPIAKNASLDGKTESASRTDTSNLPPEKSSADDQKLTSPLASGESRVARTTIEYGPDKGEPEKGDSAASAPSATTAEKVPRETEGSASSQGAEGKPTEDIAAPTESASKQAETVREMTAAEEKPASVSESVKPAAAIEKALPSSTAKPPPVAKISKQGLVSNSARKPHNPGLRPDEMYSAFLPRERRWFVPAAVLVVLLVGGWLALRSSSTEGESQILHSAETLQETSVTTRVARASDAGQADVLAGDSLPVAVATTIMAAAAASDAQSADSGLGRSTAVAGLPIIAAGSVQPLSADSGAQGNEELLARCRKANAGGRGRASAVLAACRPAIAVEPKAGDVMVFLARAELDREHAVEARIWAKKALEVDEDLADAYIYLGGAEQELGNSDDAKAAYKKYLELAPSGRYARELRVVLDTL